jgi:hypothetical protein
MLESERVHACEYEFCNLSCPCDRFKARVVRLQPTSQLLPHPPTMSTLLSEPSPVDNSEASKSTQQAPELVLECPQSHNGEQQLEKPLHTAPPFRKYTRQQLVLLSTSSLVKPPPNMPELKVWFG